ncbi:photolyase/cryptochrome dash [Klebsormidium nitens]|uniref:Cryptochrome DASH n=1 Tax=Klebsormidium nitens TaxID=105231 RepID=A0A1Y1HMX6_KLENI|nr:photolyase/cryptochrome dash [Klebsormidium nitens]|eukprot:GAQ77897.1 photolyase/cryptochrome dash [Klebsormidium nitens]
MVSILRSASCPTAKAVSNCSAKWALRQLAPAQPIIARHVSKPARLNLHPTFTPARSSVRGIPQPSGPSFPHRRAEGSFRSRAAQFKSNQVGEGFASFGSLGATSNLETVSTPSLPSSFRGSPLQGSWTLVGFVRVRSAGGHRQGRGFCTQAAAREFVIKETDMASTKETPVILWFRSDLRLHDNEALVRAAEASDSVVPVFCFDPRIYGRTYHFGFQKTGPLRAQFIWDAVSDLRQQLRQRGADLLVRVSNPEDVIPSLAKSVGAQRVFASLETCSEEKAVERRMLHKLQEGNSRGFLELVWGGVTMYHIDDLPFPAAAVPDVYTQFRKGVESRSKVREPLKIPKLKPISKEVLGKIQAAGGPGEMPRLEALGVDPQAMDPRGVLPFKGGETAALERLNDYFWTKDCLKEYKETRNGMLGGDYSSKFSAWLAHGCISPRYIHSEVRRYERERVENKSTYWLLFELIWRDYFRFISIKFGDKLFKLGGLRDVRGKEWGQNKQLFDTWREGRTGYPLVDANMKELAATGFMSNRGRQIVCSFLTRDMKLDWRLGAEWFETCLLDYDPCSNYGNWTYGAGVGNDPREDRYFSIPKQAQNYDSEGAYVAYWLPEIAKLPTYKRHAPNTLTREEQDKYDVEIGPGGYPAPVVPLLHGQPGGGGRGGGFSGRGRGGGRDGRSGRGRGGRDGRAAKF